MIFSPCLTLLVLALTPSPAIPTQLEVPPVHCVDDLLHLNRCELETLYHHATPGSMPHGYTPGKALFAPGTHRTVRLSKAAHLVWQGKYFSPECGTIQNSVFGRRMITAQLRVAESWFDGQPSIVMDYAGTSKLAAAVRDEIREVAPGVYLGMMYQRKCPCPEFTMFFVLQSCGCR